MADSGSYKGFPHNSGHLYRIAFVDRHVVKPESGQKCPSWTKKSSQESPRSILTDIDGTMRKGPQTGSRAWSNPGCIPGASAPRLSLVSSIRIMTRHLSLG